VTEAALMDALQDAATPPPSKDFRPGVIYAGNYPAEITTGAIAELGTEQEDWQAAVLAMGVPLPDGSSLELVSAEYVSSHNAAAWHRDESDKGEPHTAYTAPNTTHRWRYKFRVVAGPLFHARDMEKALAAARKAVRGRPVVPVSTTRSMVINLADFQWGKVDILGGTPEALERSEVVLRDLIARVRRLKPAELILVDNGDSTEGFNSAPNAARVNDLQETEALFQWQELFWHYIKTLAKLVESMKVISVPSNHCANRKGKDRVGPISDDWGLLTLRQLAKRAEENEAAYGHIDFIIPREYEEHVTITLLGGKVVSFVHGHQAGNPNALIDWAKGKASRDVVFSDILVVGHFHHLRVVAYGENQWAMICPTMDPGSSHYTVRTREASKPGVLSFLVDESGWSDLHVSWAV
jgi:hypothetical protein